ncbi:MAG: WavE lipopolysaccharide synthesis family protein [Desulfovibrio sp.]|jgi:hypothetical protein|nr:WavE lipopolysaccharide synthesis family protein [Desulfovibrio sp.]
MIESKDITVIVQGKIDQRITPLSLLSIRKNLQHAQIILSTWENSNTANLSYDILVLNKDPGAKIHDYVFNVKNNVNRQLISTQEGLKKVNRKYSLKIRSDLILLNNNFLQFWDRFSNINEKYKLFTHRVLTSSIYARELSSETGRPLPFHPSDFWFFGLTQDIKHYFLYTDPMIDSDISHYHLKYPNEIPYHNLSWRYTPEQYYCISYVKRILKDIKFDDWTDFNEKNIKMSSQILYNNFIFLDLKKSGIYSEKHSWAMNNEFCINGLITYDLFQQRYKDICDNNYIIVLSYTNYFIKFKKIQQKIIINMKRIIKLISQFLFFIWYSPKFIINKLKIKI